jgi:ubiquinone/menaquinone biosynthesis C-methylase UbiE
MGESIRFDRIADRYDETRGGLQRGIDLVGPMLPHLHPGAVFEVGVGTGVVAAALTEAGHPVIGVDLSLPMLSRARDRLGPRVAAADGYRLPLAEGAVRNAVIVWVLQLVPDIPGLLAEVARVVAPGGRVVVVPSLGRWDPDGMSEIVFAATDVLRPRLDQPDRVIEAAGQAGLRHLTTAPTVAHREDASPAETARRIEEREWSVFWDLADEQWSTIVEPAIAALRALPDPDRVRERRSRHDVVVLERP